jgi:hypothetical protein
MDRGRCRVPTLHRKSPGSQLLDLTRRLAEDYDMLPLRDIRRSVREAAELVATAGAGIAETLTLIERIARDDLTVLAATSRSA